jgi:hypothetical protein
MGGCHFYVLEAIREGTSFQREIVTRVYGRVLGVFEVIVVTEIEGM